MALTAQQIAAMDQVSGFQPQPKVPGWARFLLPAAGATVGGVAGSGLGALLGLETGPGAAVTGYAGGVAGAGLGAAAGQAGVNDLERFMGGTPPPTANANATSLTQAGQAGAVGQAVGAPIAKGLGLAFHPIANAADALNQKLAQSPAVIDIGQTLAKFRPLQQAAFNRQTIGREGQQAVQTLQPNLVTAVKALQAHLPAENPAPGTMMPQGDIADLSLPAQAANQLKRSIYQQVGENYGEPNVKPLIQAQKGFATVLKNDIHQAVPGTAKYDKLLSVLYKTPDFLSQLAKGSEMGKALEKISGLPLAGAQKVIPQNGGYLQKLLPFLFSGSLNTQ